MNIRSKLRGIIKAIGATHRVRIEGISVGFKIVVSIVLSYVLATAIAYVFNLSSSIRYVLVAVSSIIVSLLVSIKPRLLVGVVCVMLSFIGLLFIVVSMNEESMTEIGWNASLLGSGASIIALAIALYALLMSTERRENVLNISLGRRGMHNLEGGYVWIEDIKKYRCVYCMNLGKYHDYKTLAGIKRHIRSKHI